MASGTEGQDDKIVRLRPAQLAASGGGPHDPGMEARVAKLEAAVEHLQGDMTEVRAALGRLEPKISEMAGNFPHLATKAEISQMIGAFPHLATKADLAKRPTIAGIIAIVAAIAAIASIPIWPAWMAAIKAISTSGH